MTNSDFVWNLNRACGNELIFIHLSCYLMLLALYMYGFTGGYTSADWPLLAMLCRVCSEDIVEIILLQRNVNETDIMLMVYCQVYKILLILCPPSGVNRVKLLSFWAIHYKFPGFQEWGNLVF
jgi:hypothetical protein